MRSRVYMVVFIVCFMLILLGYINMRVKSGDFATAHRYNGVLKPRNKHISLAHNER